MNGPGGPDDALSIKERISLTHLPLTREFSTQKRHRDERGTAHLILNGPLVRRVGFLTLRKGAGHRGGHWHRYKSEGLYLVEGKARVELVWVASGETLAVQMVPGDRLDIPPGLAHRIEALRDAQFVEYADKAYDPDDDIAFNFSQTGYQDVILS